MIENDYSMFPYEAELLRNLDAAYSELWACCKQINDYVNTDYQGNKNEFISKVAHSCDYFSMADVLRECFNKLCEF